MAQAAGASPAVSGDLTAVEKMREAFDRRRRTIVRMLNEIDGVVCPEPKGAFYRVPVGEGAARQEIRGKRPQDSVELAALILEEAEVAVVPGEAFGTPGYLRLSYALGDEDLVAGRLARPSCWPRRGTEFPLLRAESLANRPPPQGGGPFLRSGGAPKVEGATGTTGTYGRIFGMEREARDVRQLPRPICTCTSPGRCGPRPCSNSPASTACGCPRR